MEQTAVVQYNGVEVVALRKAPDLSEEGAAADGCQIERLFQAQRTDAVVQEPPAQLAGLDGVHHRPKQAEAAAAGHVGSQPDVQPELKIAGDRRDAGGQVHVGFRAVGNEDAVLPDQLQLPVCGMDAMGHDAGMIPAKEAEALVGFSVAAGGRGELPHPGDLSEILTQMALDGQTVFSLQILQSGHQRVGTGRNEAGRQDRLRVMESAACVADPPFRFPHSGFRVRLPHGVGAVPIHIHLAHIASKPGLFQLRHEAQGGGRVDGGKDRGPGGGGVHKGIHKACIGLFRVGGVAVFCLLGEGIAVEPVQKLHVHAEAAEGKLRGVDVQIAHAGEDQLVSAVGHRQGLKLLRDDGEDAAADSADDRQIAGLDDPELFRAFAVQEAALYDKVFHEDPPFIHYTPIIMYFFQKSNQNLE